MGKIGLVGFFGWGNYGDELFLRVWRERLGEVHDVSPVGDLLEAPFLSRNAKDIAAEYDAFVIGGGDLVIPTNISPLYWNKAWLAKPIYIAGVGVPTWIKSERKDVIERLRLFFQHRNVKYISARDEESAAWIRSKLSPVVPVAVHADLVFALPVPEARTYVGPTIGVAVRHQRKGAADLTQVEQTLNRIGRSGFDVVRIVLGIGETGQRDLEVANSLDVPGDIVYSEDLDALSAAIGGLHSLLSMKFHGTVVATAYGVPSIVLSATSKSQNLYRRIDRLSLLSSTSDEAMYDKATRLAQRVPYTVRDELVSDAERGLSALVERVNAEVGGGSATWRGRIRELRSSRRA